MFYVCDWFGVIYFAAGFLALIVISLFCYLICLLFGLLFWICLFVSYGCACGCCLRFRFLFADLLYILFRLGCCFAAWFLIWCYVLFLFLFGELVLCRWLLLIVVGMFVCCFVVLVGYVWFSGFSLIFCCCFGFCFATLCCC